MESNPYQTSSASIYGSADFSSAAIVSRGVIEQLLGTRPWVRFLSVMTFIGSGVLLLGGGAMLVAGGTSMASGSGRSGPSTAMGGSMLLGIALFYLFLAVLYIYPGIKLWKYATRITTFASSSAGMDLEKALNEQRAFWKFAGLSLIAVMCLYVIAIVTVAITTFMAKSGQM